jgi:uncharacterized membrane protein YgdD (TMEM256/DUF423 family)
MDQKQTLSAAAIMGGLAVAFGAFGAHALKATLTASGRLETYELAVRYQFYHTLALLAVGVLMNQFSTKKLRYAAMFFLGGIFFFSGSLYVLCFTGITILGAVTPVGGVLFILGWGFLLAGVSK